MYNYQGDVMVTGVQDFKHHSELLPTAPARLRRASTVGFAFIRASHSQKALVNIGPRALTQVGQLQEELLNAAVLTRPRPLTCLATEDPPA